MPLVGDNLPQLSSRRRDTPNLGHSLSAVWASCVVPVTSLLAVTSRTAVERQATNAKRQGQSIASPFQFSLTGVTLFSVLFTMGQVNTNFIVWNVQIQWQ